MKKLFFLMPLAAVALASCSSDETQSVAPKQSANQVNFLPAMNGATRGEIYTDAGFSASMTTEEGFIAICSGLFYTSDPTATGASASQTTIDKTVKYVSGAWTMADGDNNLWWGDATTAAKFTAFAPKTAASNLSADKKSISFTPATTITDQKDLVVAYNEGNRTAFSAGVPLHFRHALSQIVVRASYKDDPNFSTATYPTKSVKIKQIRFRNIQGTGTLTLPTAATTSGTEYLPAWVIESSNMVGYSTSELSEGLSLNSTSQSVLKTGDNALLLIPQEQAAATTLASHPSTGSYIEALVNIDEGSNDIYPVANATASGFDWIAVPVEITWNGGYKYTYTLNFSNIACGKISPNAESTTLPIASGTTQKKKGDDVISGVPYPVNFLVTVEDQWTENTGTSITPGL